MTMMMTKVAQDCGIARKAQRRFVFDKPPTTNILETEP